MLLAVQLALLIQALLKLLPLLNGDHFVLESRIVLRVHHAGLQAHDVAR